MGPELDLAELAVLRPVLTAASSAGGAAATTRPANDNDDDGAHQEAAADTDCVTPTATIPVVLPWQGGAAGVDAGADADAASYFTPTTDASLLRPATVCPPAPRKPARPPVAKRKRCCARPGLQRSFFPVPHDLGAVFVPRPRPAAGAEPGSPPRGSKKIRLHAVG